MSLAGMLLIGILIFGLIPEEGGEKNEAQHRSENEKSGFGIELDQLQHFFVLWRKISVLMKFSVFHFLNIKIFFSFAGWGV